MNDMRKYITLVESQELEEAGGFLDRLMSKLPGKMGVRAGGRVDHKEMFKLLRNSWIKYAASRRVNEKDPEEIADFLQQASLSDEQIAQIPALQKDKVNINDVFDDAADFVIQNAGPEFGASDGKAGKKMKAKGTPTGDSKDDIMKFFRNMGGDPRELTREFKAARGVKHLSDDPLGRLGYAHYEVSGR